MCETIQKYSGVWFVSTTPQENAKQHKTNDYHVSSYGSYFNDTESPRNTVSMLATVLFLVKFNADRIYWWQPATMM